MNRSTLFLAGGLIVGAFTYFLFQNHLQTLAGGANPTGGNSPKFTLNLPTIRLPNTIIYAGKQINPFTLFTPSTYSIPKPVNAVTPQLYTTPIPVIPRYVSPQPVSRPTQQYQACTVGQQAGSSPNCYVCTGGNYWVQDPSCGGNLPAPPTVTTTTATTTTSQEYGCPGMVGCGGYCCPANCSCGSNGLCQCGSSIGGLLSSIRQVFIR